MRDGEAEQPEAAEGARERDGGAGQAARASAQEERAADLQSAPPSTPSEGIAEHDVVA